LVILSVLLLLGTWARHMMLADRGSVA
jgi:hypothetical protein